MFKNYLTIFIKLFCINFIVWNNTLQAGILFEPYFSIKSTKSITPKRSSGTETETVKNREEKGIKAGLSFYRIFRLQASVGQSFLSTTSTTSEIKDDYDEIDFSSEINLNPSSTDQTLVKKEFDNRASLSLLLDSSFSIFIARFKAGVTARQRSIKVTNNNIEVLNKNPAISYKPLASAGLGFRFSYRMYAILEYGFYLYKFPEQTPFERDLTLNVGFSI